MIVVFAVSYVLRTQAKKNSDIDTIRWRLDFWFVLRTFVWLLCFANFFIRGVYLANYHNDTGGSIALLVGSLLVVYVMLLGLQGHRGGKRCLDLGDIHMYGKQLHVYFTDDKDEEKGSPGKKDDEGGKKKEKSEIEQPLNKK
jgi:cell division protein FtsW (lipid II flippase)